MKNLNVTGKKNIFFIISLILIFISVGALLYKGLNFGIDFIGGTIIQIELNEKFETSDISEIIDTYDKSADITYSGDEKTQVIINTKVDLSEDQRKEVFQIFKDKYDLEDEDLLSIEKVSPSIGSELKRQSLIAAVIAVVCMLIYITFRFEFTFGIASIIALVHDLLIVLGVYAIFQIQVNTPFIAAILTILGYSINDTIVVFDRIRENRKKDKKLDFAELVNRSISQTITRSINTSLTTLLALSALYVLGVQSIKDFAFPMIIGFVSGAYSSIFVASSFWFWVNEKKLKSTKS
ncbi:MAG: protein translocase subunit SecF [Eubacteriaceae bacterium]